MLRIKVLEASKPKHEPSGTRSKFQTVGSQDESSIASCNSCSSQGMRRVKRAHEDLRDKLNAKRASQMTATSSGALGLMEKMENLKAQVKLLSEKQNVTSAPTPMTYHSPFTMEIQTVALLEAFTIPQILQYSGTTNPSEHAELYRDQMLIKGVDKSTMYMMFTHILTGPAKSWFRLLKVGSIYSLHQLLSEFTKKFSYASTQDNAASKLAFIKQREV